MGDFSRDPETVLQEAIASGYSRVRFQQGKPLLDRDLNLLADLASPQRFARNNFGNGIRDEGNDFLITNLDVPGNDFRIRAGSCLVDGCEVVLPANTTYKTQPHSENAAALPAGASNVYLRVFRTETTGAADAALLNAVDVGAETSVREKVEWEVLVTALTINTRDHFLLASINTVGTTITDRRRRGLNVDSIRDEVTSARGSTAQLSARLDVSLTAAGALRQNVVANTQIADNSLAGTKLTDASVVNAKLADNAVTTQKLADNAVTTQEIADNAVSGQKIADNAVSGQKIANNSVSTQKIAANAVTNPQLADNAVSGNKIANNGVTANKIAAGVVTEPTLANNAVSNRTIANGVVTIEKMNAPQVLGQQVTIAAAPVNGRTEQVVNLQETDGHAFFLVSVHFDEPRPGGIVPVSRSINWNYRVTLQKLIIPGQFRHFHQVVIENTNQVEIKATVRALRLAES
jgi:hypothetical protein